MKKLEHLTDKEYNKLIKAGMLYVLYPEATGDYEIDVKDSCGDKPTFEVGDWIRYILKTGILSDDEIRCGRINDHSSGLYVIDKKITIHAVHIIEKLTPEEIESHLIAEAKRRGYKKGVTFGNDTFKDTMIRDRFYYAPELDVLYVDTDRDAETAICSNGHWSEIIKDEPIKIGGYEVEIGEYKIKVGCKHFDKSDLHTIGVMMELCRSKEIDLSLNGETIYLLSADGRSEHGSLTYEDFDKIYNKLK